MEADDGQRTILQRWRRAVVEDASEAARKMQINEDKALQGQDQALVPQAPQRPPAEQIPVAQQPTEADERALQAMVQQSRSKRRADREVAPSPPQQRMAAIQ
eukprot:5440475-Amphidinium_carterae.1